MNDKLRDLIGQANTRLEAAETQRESGRERAQQEEQDKDFEKFRNKVESVLGKEVLDTIGPVTFHKDFLNHSMTFVQDSRTFRLHQVTGFLMQVEENGRPVGQGRQFNLNNADSKDTFLNVLGAALKK